MQTKLERHEQEYPKQASESQQDHGQGGNFRDEEVEQGFIGVAPPLQQNQKRVADEADEAGKTTPFRNIVMQGYGGTSGFKLRSGHGSVELQLNQIEVRLQITG
ncbi:MAG TPA: hypothetical protein PKO06_23825 [Candidatus Ozemobacteraceae bacterium]|nr:hypothetical protein [Candidatus Ozemobacteraceae bacterium]